jgi:hypothetical protein
MIHDAQGTMPDGAMGCRDDTMHTAAISLTDCWHSFTRRGLREIVFSLQGNVGSHRSLIEAVLLKRGSNVMSLAPSALASMMRWTWGLK